MLHDLNKQIFPNTGYIRGSNQVNSTWIRKSVFPTIHFHTRVHKISNFVPFFVTSVPLCFAVNTFVLNVPMFHIWAKLKIRLFMCLSCRIRSKKNTWSTGSGSFAPVPLKGYTSNLCKIFKYSRSYNIDILPGMNMVLILDGSSEHVAHAWTKKSLFG